MQTATQSATGPRPQQPYSPWFWALLGALALAQLIAFGLLCSSQVRKAQARDSQFVVQQMALSDCLQYVPGSTVASCTRSVELVRASEQDTSVAGAPGMATPVSFNYR
ncbi:MAG: hypothetical protein EOO21_06775 [Comamonadaceae bacterium]|nr:MAG: hypothetical protein EOO21_06775 [Comamonadaceae bacterium]